MLVVAGPIFVCFRFEYHTGYDTLSPLVHVSDSSPLGMTDPFHTGKDRGSPRVSDIGVPLNLLTSWSLSLLTTSLFYRIDLGPSLFTRGQSRGRTGYSPPPFISLFKKTLPRTRVGGTDRQHLHRPPVGGSFPSNTHLTQSFRYVPEKSKNSNKKKRTSLPP